MGALQAELCRGAPGACIVYFYNGAGTSKYETPPTIEAVAGRYPAPGGVPYERVTLAGWSAGGRAVQRQLDAALYRGGRVPDAVLVADGLYAPLAGNHVQMSGLRSIIDFAARAATEPGRVCVLWHSAIPTPGYASSSRCVAAVRAEVEKNLGAALQPFSPPPLDGHPIEAAVRLGGFVVLSYAGADGPEHVREGRLIEKVLQAFVPWYADALTNVPQADAPPAPAPDAPGSASALALALVKATRKDLGVHEEGGGNCGPRVNEYLHNVGLNPGNEWCAAAVTTWLREAAQKLGVEPTVPGGAAAKAFISQFQNVNRWIPRAKLADRAAPGMIVVFDRTADPNDWRGHIGVVESVDSNGLHTIEGNSGPRCDAVVRKTHRFDESRLRGAGMV
jgi:hypothetical protein